MSAWRFLLPGLFASAMLGVFWTTIVNPLSVVANEKFDQIVKDMTRPNVSQVSDQDTQRKIWLREGSDTGQQVIYAESANLEQRTLTDVTFYRFVFDADRTPVFDSRFDASTARLTRDNQWVLTDVVETRSGAAPQPYETISAPTTMSWDSLREATGSFKTPNFWDMPGEISKTQQAGFSSRPLIIRFNKLLALPVMLLAMALLAAAVSMRLVRLGGTLGLIISGAAIGFGVFFANSMAAAFGETASLPPMLSAWVVPLFVLFIGLARLCTIEDG